LLQAMDLREEIGSEMLSGPCILQLAEHIALVLSWKLSLRSE